MPVGVSVCFANIVLMIQFIHWNKLVVREGCLCIAVPDVSLSLLKVSWFTHVPLQPALKEGAVTDTIASIP